MSYKRWIFVAIFLFGIGLAFGLITPTSVPSPIAEDITILEEFVSLLASLPLALVVVIIFMKNASALLLGFVFSPILCLVPILTLTLNGWLLGWVSVVVSQEESLGFVLSGLLPHGT